MALLQNKKTTSIFEVFRNVLGTWKFLIYSSKKDSMKTRFVKSISKSRILKL